MFNHGVFTVRIEKQYETIKYYKNKIPIYSFLVEICPKSKINQRLRIKLRIAGKLNQKDNYQPGQYLIVEGSVANSILDNLEQNSETKKYLELNAYKIYSAVG